MENRIKLKTEECRLLSASLDEAQELVASLKKEKEEEMKKVNNSLNTKNLLLLVSEFMEAIDHLELVTDGASLRREFRVSTEKL